MTIATRPAIAWAPFQESPQMQLHQIREARAAKVQEARSLLASTPQLNAEGQAKFDKLKSTGRIDGLVALAMALNGATGAKPEEAQAAGIFDWSTYLEGRA